MLDTRLRFEAHAEYACTKARKTWAKVKRLIHDRKWLSVQLGVQLYKCLVRSHLEFAIPAWANLPDNSLKKLERVQVSVYGALLAPELILAWKPWK